MSEILDCLNESNFLKRKAFNAVFGEINNPRTREALAKEIKLYLKKKKKVFGIKRFKVVCNRSTNYNVDPCNFAIEAKIHLFFDNYEQILNLELMPNGMLVYEDHARNTFIDIIYRGEGLEPNKDKIASLIKPYLEDKNKLKGVLLDREGIKKIIKKDIRSLLSRYDKPYSMLIDVIEKRGTFWETVFTKIKIKWNLKMRIRDVFCIQIIMDSRYALTQNKKLSTN